MSDLVTERLVLHPLTAGESERLVAGEPEAGARWAPGYPTVGDVMAATRFLGTCTKTSAPQGLPFGNFEIRRRADGQAIGGIGFHGLPDEQGSVSVGFGLSPAAQGQGYAAEALRHLLLFARECGVTSVRGGTSREDTAGQRVMTAAGMRLTHQDEQVSHFEMTWTDLSG
ncbi:GNAT family N-acetyltransferase [Kitasatospora sp. MMS16-BH015]|uniref:GNAT family N-acetyltransferase n=1 Tax=Kitasatospora sp. MMS16-BH015 TaxID=2018025 RepID=UPI000CF2EA6D|nr:GNAT family N-acetyltransferase [Kitasatospora sp. MMS16-BH015]